MSRKATIKYFLILVTISLVALSCSTGDSNSVNSVESSDYISEVKGDNPSTHSVVTPNTQGSKSSNSGSVPPTTVANMGTMTNGGQPITSSSSIQNPQVAPTTVPLFRSFTCSIQVSDTTQQASLNSRVIRIDLIIEETKIETIPVEVRTNGVSKRLLIQVQKSGTGYSQVVVPGKGISYVSAYASPDFIPESRMCSAQG